MKKLLAATAILFCLISLVGAPARAQETAITIKSEQVTDQVTNGKPSGVLFQLTAETIAPAQINEIRIVAKVKGSRNSFSDNVKFTPGASVDGTYLLKASGAQYKPPGTSIEYHYVITDSQQRTLETPAETHLYLDNRFTWSHVTDGIVDVYYYSSVKATDADLVMKAGAQTIGKIGKLLGIKITEPVRVMGYSSPRDMIPAQPFESQTSERELLLEGVTFPEYGTLLMIIAGDRPDGIASHEITHVLVGKLTTNTLAEVPAWLNEGLAENGNVHRGTEFDSLLSQAISQNRLLPLRNMQAPPGITNDRLLMYGQGYAVVKFMIEKYGEDKFRALFAAFTKGLRINEAMQSVYGFDQDGLDDAWRASLGLPPVEKAAPSASPAPTQPAQPVTPAPATSATPTENKGGGFNATPIIIIVAVGVIALVIGVILISRTKPRTGGPSS